MSETVPKSEQGQPAQLVEKVEQESKAEGDGQEIAITDGALEGATGAEEPQPEAVTSTSISVGRSDNSSLRGYPIAGSGTWTYIAQENTCRGLLDFYTLPSEPRDYPGTQAGDQ